MLFVEQPNKTFLARSGRNNEANLYKIQWFNQDVAGAHEKKTNRSTGHQDVETLIQNLNRLNGEAQWKYIQEQFNVTNVINYFAVNMLVQNWDGFFNNYYAYHDTKPGGKWEMIPWDEDKTWGEYDGASQNYDWYEMPLTMGMKGDRPARSGWGGGGPFGGAGWWRPAGWFSGPLLSNPQFRKLFLARIKELCQTEFTEQRFGPVIQGLANRLRPEIDAQGRGSQFDRDIESFHRQLANRRKFLLKELERQ
jgi:spore coat protein CotH